MLYYKYKEKGRLQWNLYLELQSLYLALPGFGIGFTKDFEKNVYLNG